MPHCTGPNVLVLGKQINMVYVRNASVVYVPLEWRSAVGLLVSGYLMCSNGFPTSHS